MAIIKGWRKSKASNYKLSSWVANENESNETILALLRIKGKNKVKIVRKKSLNSVKADIIFEKDFNTPHWAYAYAIEYMKSHQRG